MVLTESTPVFFSNNSTSGGTQATWLDTSILRSSLFFTRKSVADSLASGNPIRSNFPIRICGSDSPTLKSAKRRLDEPLLMARMECIIVIGHQTMWAKIHNLMAGGAELSQQSLLQIKPAMIARNSYVHRELSIRFLAIQERVAPASRRSDSLGVSRSPGIRFVFVYGRAGLQHWIDNPPGLLHIIFPGEERGVSRHCVSKDSFVSVHLPGARVPAGQQFRQIAL